MHRLLRHLDSGFLALVPCSRASSSPATATASPSTLATPGDHPNPAEFAVAAEQAASARAASIVSAATASQIVSVVTVLAADQLTAVAVALAVVSDALKRPVASSTR